MTSLALTFTAGLVVGALTNNPKEQSMYSKIIGTTRRGKIARAVVVLALASASAFAAWLILSQGSGAGKVGTLQAPTVSPGTASADLYPGGDGSLTFSVNNPNSALVVTSVDAGPGSVSSAQCSAGFIHPKAKTFATPIAVPAGTSEVKLAGVVSLDSDAPQGSCEGASFTAPMTLHFSTP